MLRREIGLLVLLFAAQLLAYPLPRAVDNIVNVKDHGARGDGVADDTEAIRAAIARARELVEDPESPYPCPHYGVRVLYFPSGTYLVSSTLQLYPDVQVITNIWINDKCDSAHGGFLLPGFPEWDGCSTVVFPHVADANCDGRECRIHDCATHRSQPRVQQFQRPTCALPHLSWLASQ